MSIKVYTQNEKFYMEDLTNNTTVELTEKTHDGISFKLPENSANRKFCSIKAAEKGVTLEYKESKTFGPREKSDTSKPQTTSKAPKLNELVELLTDEERKIYKELMDKAAKRLADKKKVDKIAELKAEVARLEAEINGENEEA